MNRPPLALFAAFLACGGSNGQQPAEDGSDARPESASADARPGDGGGVAMTNFAEPGPYAVTQTAGQLPVDGCSMAYVLFAPAELPLPPLLVLGHGFTRSKEHMAGLAEHIASFGIRVATPDFCHLSVGDTDHAQNGVDAAALGAALAEGKPLIYAGYSAGGLAAVLAGAADPATAAVLGLDLVDSEDLAAGASSMTVPMLGLAGEPASCNATGNGVPVYQVANRWAARIPGATHCDFEDPTDGLCGIVCGSETGAVDLVKAVAAAFAAWQLGIDPSGAQWASPTGSKWQALVSDGDLVVL